MAWLLLLFAGLLEVGWAIGLKHAAGFTRPLVTAATLGAMLASLGLLGLALRHLPLGTAYAVWTGIGIVGTAVVGIVWYGEPADAQRVVSIALVMAGIVGLKLS